MFFVYIPDVVHNMEACWQCQLAHQSCQQRYKDVTDGLANLGPIRIYRSSKSTLPIRAS